MSGTRTDEVTTATGRTEPARGAATRTDRRAGGPSAGPRPSAGRRSAHRAPAAPPLRTARQTAVDVLVLGLAVGLALLPLAPVYGAGAVVAPVLGGVALGAATAVVAARRRWSVLTTIAVAVVVYLVAGAPLAARGEATFGLLPSPASTLDLLTGAVTAWKQVLTLDPSLGDAGTLLAAPFLLALGGTLGALGVALRSRTRAAWVALVPVVVLGVAVLLGTKETVVPAVAGTVVGLVLLVWASWRLGRLQLRRLVALVLLGGVLAAAGAVAGPVVGEQRPRFVLRDEIVPPFDPRDHPSPLSGFRAYVKQWKDTELFTVRGLPEGAAIRLATMDAYDGVVFDVAGSEQAEGSGGFRRVGDTIATTARGPEVTVEVEVHQLPSVWLPTVGYATSVEASGRAARVLTDQLRYNDATGTAVVTGGVPEGARYTLDAVLPPAPDEDEVSEAATLSVALPEPEQVPDAIPLRAGEVAGTATSPGLIALSLEAGLAERGYFSHGQTGSGEYPSLSGHGADRLTTLLTGDLMVGDGEQYASAMALMARSMGLPARVVMGFVPDEEQAEAEEVTVTGDDVSAWVEIAFTGYGWVAFHPTPPETRTPEQDTPEEQSDPQPQVVQPPPPPADPVQPPDDDTEQPRTDDTEQQETVDDTLRRVLTVVGVAAVPLVLVVLPLLLVAAAKDRRRRRRRTAGGAVSRVVGGWDEVLDRARDLRRPAPELATRREVAVELAAAFAAADRARGSAATGRQRAAVGGPVATLAARADAAVFGAGEPSDAEVEAFWRQVEATLATMGRAVPRRRRLLARVSTASLRARRSARRRGGRG